MGGYFFVATVIGIKKMDYLDARSLKTGEFIL